MTDVHHLTATEMLAGFADRSLSPVEAAEACLARIDELDGRVNAFCHLDHEGTLATARASEDRWQRGEPLGLVDGVPTAVKDVFLTRGWPTRRGSALVDVDADWPDDAPVVSALRRHGATLVGKTTTPELGWKGVTDSPATGITGNPWDPSRTAGGSSGGSAAAVVLGMAPLALGTDGGGSIRIPAGFSGTVGHKPTGSLVPLWPVSPYGTLGHAGPMTWTVADAALMLDVLAEPDPRDWTQLAPIAPTRDALDGGIAGLRIAYSPDLGWVDVDPDVARLVAEAVDVLAELGAHVERVDPGFDDPVRVFSTLWNSGAAAATAGTTDEDRARMDPGLVENAGVVCELRVLRQQHHRAPWRRHGVAGRRASRADHLLGRHHHRQPAAAVRRDLRDAEDGCRDLPQGQRSDRGRSIGPGNPRLRRLGPEPLLQHRKPAGFGEGRRQRCQDQGRDREQRSHPVHGHPGTELVDSEGGVGFHASFVMCWISLRLPGTSCLRRSGSSRPSPAAS
jgi:aspartyl-tRNA(Asn)/glutamyl-tRNA(Gln) amidotransferase subunit A